MPRMRTAPAAPHAPGFASNRVYVLSRITLGADVAVTSVLLDAAKRRYPEAEDRIRRAAKNGLNCSRPIRAFGISPLLTLGAARLADRLAASAACGSTTES